MFEAKYHHTQSRQENTDVVKNKDHKIFLRTVAIELIVNHSESV